VMFPKKRPYTTGGESSASEKHRQSCSPTIRTAPATAAISKTDQRTYATSKSTRARGTSARIASGG